MLMPSESRCTANCIFAMALAFAGFFTVRYVAGLGIREIPAVSKQCSQRCVRQWAG